jgi:hypothetical protein
METIETAIRRGEVLGVRLGDSQQRVRDLLGEPPGVSTRLPCIWKFGAVEFSFVDDRVNLIALYFHAGESKLPSQVNGWLPVTPDDAIIHLRAIGHACEVVPSLSFDAQQCLRVSSSGVMLLFNNEKLHSIFLGS